MTGLEEFRLLVTKPVGYGPDAEIPLRRAFELILLALEDLDRRVGEKREIALD